jgi:FHA domain
VATCPDGHASASDDFCDVCGRLIGALPSLAPATEASPVTGPGAEPDQSCPECGATRRGRFCESCGHDFAAGPPVPVPAPPTGPAPVTTLPPPPVPAPAAPAATAEPTGAATVWPGLPAAVSAWAVTVTADRAYYDRVQAHGGPDAGGIAFPAYFPQRHFRLDEPEIRICRRSASSGISPEIDLSVPPADPGVSRLHAVLLRAPDGSWAVIDPGSANGTIVNGSEIPAGQAVPLREGDRIHLGAWTELRLIRLAEYR